MMTAEEACLAFNADRDVLLDGFVRAGRAIETNMSGAIYQGLLCESRGGTGLLDVTGTSAGRAIRVAVPVSVRSEGRFVVPGRLFTNALAKMPEGMLAVEQSGGSVNVSAQGAGEDGPQFVLRRMSADDYPAMHVSSVDDAVTLSGEELSSAIAQVAGAASNDKDRPILTGVRIESEDGGMRLAATDSYRMAVRDLPGAAPSQSGLVGARDLSELDRTIGAEKVSVVVDDNAVMFSSERGVLSLRMLVGSYPDYRSLFDGDRPSRMTFNRERMLDALGRAMIVSTDLAPAKLVLSSAGIELSIQQSDVGDESEMIEGHFESPEERIDVAYNPGYIRYGVAAVESDEVVLELLDGLKPGLIRGRDTDGFRYLVMPVRMPG